MLKVIDMSWIVPKILEFGNEAVNEGRTAKRIKSDGKRLRHSNILLLDNLIAK